MPTLGLHLIWTTYGTWLPGDDRGNWSPLLDLWGSYLGKRHTENAGDERTHLRAKALMKGEEVTLTAAEQESTAHIIHALAQPTPIRALAIERSHIHLQIDATPTSIGTLIGRIKGKSSSAILAQRPPVTNRRIWTTGYCVKFLCSKDALMAVQNYIENHNISRSLPPAPWPFVQRHW